MKLALMGAKKKFQGLFNQFGVPEFGVGLRLLDRNHSGGLIRAVAETGGVAQGSAIVLPYRVSATEYRLDLNSKIEDLDLTATDRGLVAGDTLADLLDVDTSNYNGKISTWINQGSLKTANDATQSTLTNMPNFATGGILDVENGKPTVTFSGATGSGFVIPNFAYDRANFYANHIVKITNLVSNPYTFGDYQSGGNNRSWALRTNSSDYALNGSTDGTTGAGFYLLQTSTTSPTGLDVFSLVSKATDNPKVSLFSNGAEISFTRTVGAVTDYTFFNASTQLSIGGVLSAPDTIVANFVGIGSEFLVYDGGNSIRSKLEQNQKEYYGIS